jgi:hypothetical protein
MIVSRGIADGYAHNLGRANRSEETLSLNKFLPPPRMSR